MKVLAGTMNPGKLQGIKEAFEVFCDDVEVIGYKASSGVSDQPVSGETLEGARNRMRDTIEYAIKEDIDVSYFASIESGIVELYNNSTAKLLLVPGLPIIIKGIEQSMQIKQVNKFSLKA